MIFLLSAIRTNSLKSGFKDGIPRLCGEKALRAWADHGKLRITPAYAGKSIFPDGAGSGQQDHPRLCGEKLRSGFFFRLRNGSPPPMRGKGFYRGFRSFSDGITPAYAGKSAFRPHTRTEDTNHPRLCGEKLLGAAGGAASSGSPPPMRGKDKRR